MRSKKKKLAESVELNLAAMLDMAFQLLTFFILTFQPARVEGQISLRMPPPQSVTPLNQRRKPGEKISPSDPFIGLETLAITLAANPRDGGLRAMRVGTELVGSLGRLDDKLRSIFSDPLSSKEQVVISVDSQLSYAALMSVVEVCTRQWVTTRDGEKVPLAKLSFVELAGE